MQNFLICITANQDNEILAPQIFEVSRDISVEDVTFPLNTVCLYFKKANSKQEALNDFFSIGAGSAQLVNFSLPRQNKVYFIGQKVSIPGVGECVLNHSTGTVLPMFSNLADHEIIPE